MSTKCPSDEELLDHCLGRSRDDLLASIASHVETCRHCEERLRHLDQATDIQRNRSLESTVDLGLADTGDNHGSRAARLLPVGLPSIDNYEILEVLGQGGMGIVVKARQTRLNRDVAIKFPRHVADDIDRQRFLREARAAGGLRHPHICPVYEVGESDGRPFM